MPKVDIEELEKLEKQKLTSPDDIEVKIVNGRRVFRGQYLKNDWYDSYEDAQSANQTAKRIDDLKAKGLNEHGQTIEQVKLNQRVQELVALKQQKLEELKALDLKINLARSGKFDEPAEEKKSKKK